MYNNGGFHRKKQQLCFGNVMNFKYKIVWLMAQSHVLQRFEVIWQQVSCNIIIESAYNITVNILKGFDGVTQVPE